MTKEENISYWIESSDSNAVTMNNLFNSKNYDWSLFIGHLVIEKLLKAYYIKHRDEHYPQIHDLLRLADRANLSLTDEQKDFLDEVTGFNISVRYEDYKKEFRKNARLSLPKNILIKSKSSGNG